MNFTDFKTIPLQFSEVRDESREEKRREEKRREEKRREEKRREEKRREEKRREEKRREEKRREEKERTNVSRGLALSAFSFQRLSRFRRQEMREASFSLEFLKAYTALVVYFAILSQNKQ
ncbi:hypothetical protein HZH68_015607 [Vespula germanica]|uniref:Uncharacterized protein n=1 Tax=Vespula germanica TaxID=30212 RepID=A0A834J7B2_VESGE|nr:hypothetical protein HZH68_015607 [Vespula germanica]